MANTRIDTLIRYDLYPYDLKIIIGICYLVTVSDSFFLSDFNISLTPFKKYRDKYFNVILLQ